MTYQIYCEAKDVENDAKRYVLFEIEFYRKGKLEKVKITIEKRPEEFSSLIDGSQNPGRKIQVVRPGVIVSENQDLQSGDEDSHVTGEENKNSDK